MDMPRILFVCGGNTCRSPMAQALAKRLLGDDAVVESAGIDAEDGAPANSKAIVAMERFGLDISNHIARDASEVDLAAFDLIVTMKPKFAERLISESGADPTKVRQIDIDDPYGKDLEAYVECAAKIEAVLPLVFQ
jgi:protein-tyrosine-phosphatase